jgi:peptidase M28-like protein
VQNTVRLAFFGGEENGGEGSDGYIRGLSNEDRKKIKLYLTGDDADRKTTGPGQGMGGQAREHYDPCYHQACDRVDNVNRDVLNHYMRALAGTLAYFATSKAKLG